jgi:UDP-N-acetylmuramoylalanine--D-glutamate ligase
MTKKGRIEGKKVSVFGMARSGMAVAKLLNRNGADVFVTDNKKEAELRSEIEELRHLNIDFEAGSHSERALDHRDYIVLSPGVNPGIPILRKAKAAGIPIFSEIEVAFWLCSAKIVGITGSNGKTTTSTLLGEILRKDSRECQVAGNIGIPFSSVVEKVSSSGIIVLELSSFQLENIEEFKPEVAALLNISADHLDRYPDLESYSRAKTKVFDNQVSQDFAILNMDDDPSIKIKDSCKAQVIFFSTAQELEKGAFIHQGKLVLRPNGKTENVLEVDEIGIKGPHNISNAICACAISAVLGVKKDSLREALRNFRGVEHRLEEVKTVSGIRFINDSKATNVRSVWYALNSIPEPILLIAGGRDKGGDFTQLREKAKEKLKSLILIGESKQKIDEALGDLVESIWVDSLEEGVKRAYQMASPGECVLLSPGCASFDMFKDYEHRGRVFKSAVRQLNSCGKNG